MMEVEGVNYLEDFIAWLGDLVWGPPMLVLLVGTGIYLSIGLKFLQFRKLGFALKMAFQKSDAQDQGDISHFQALMTALAATIGTGNIAGVATAVASGGPGALFWMWVTALFGMATKYAEAILAVKYRVVDQRGEMAGGPMYYLEHGLGWKWLGLLFALFGAIAAFGIGNMVQSNSIATSVKDLLKINPVWIGLLLAAITAAVVLGGIKSIGRVSALLVPFMAVFYILGGIIIIIKYYYLVLPALATIVEDAFTGQAMAGGAVGSVIRYGVARGVFSNEAGLGSAPIAAAAAKTDYPARQALVSMTGTFLDTIVVCSITGLVLVMTESWRSGLSGVALTTLAFGTGLPVLGNMIVGVGIVLFAYSTILGWAYYGEKCWEYIFGEKVIIIYRYIWVGAVFLGSFLSLEVVWNIADVMNGLMAVPNLIGLLGLGGVVRAETRYFFNILAKQDLH